MHNLIRLPFSSFFLSYALLWGIFGAFMHYSLGFFFFFVFGCPILIVDNFAKGIDMPFLICLWCKLIRMLDSGNHMRTCTLAKRRAEPHAHVYLFGLDQVRPKTFYLAPTHLFM